MSSASELLERRKANREKLHDLAYQLACLKECYEAISSPTVKPTDSPLKELVQALGVCSIDQLAQGEPFRPTLSGRFTVLLLFDALRRPHFEFIFRPQPKPDLDNDDRELYSAAIYEKVIAARQKAGQNENVATTAVDKNVTTDVVTTTATTTATTSDNCCHCVDKANCASAKASLEAPVSASTSNNAVKQEAMEENENRANKSNNNGGNSSNLITACSSSTLSLTPYTDFHNQRQQVLLQLKQEAQSHTVNEAPSVSSNQNSSSKKRPATDDDNLPSTPFNPLSFPVKRNPTSSFSSEPNSSIPRTASATVTSGEEGKGGGTLVCYRGDLPGSQTTSANTSSSSSSSPASTSSQSDIVDLKEAAALSNNTAIAAAFLASTEFTAATSKERLNCPICSRNLMSISLREHLTTFHLGLKPYVCKKRGCDFASGYRSSIKSHLENKHDVYDHQEQYFYYQCEF